jgi:sugar fermentation stimulation protein A
MSAKNLAKVTNLRKATDRGTYALVIYLPRAKTIRVGALGAFKFPRGYYVYIGSALNGLSARIARHLANARRLDSQSQALKNLRGERLRQWTEKKRFWHIDYLLEHARVIDVWTHESSARLECEWARVALALPNAQIVAPRFGASDCNCATHLVHLANLNSKF